MHICDHYIKVYCNIEKRKLVKIEIEIYMGGQKFIGETEIYRGGGTKIYRGWGQKWTSTSGIFSRRKNNCQAV